MEDINHYFWTKFKMLQQPSQKLLSFFFCLLFFGLSFAQEQKRIEIKYSGFLEFKEEEAPGLKVMTRDDTQQIHVIHEGVNMYCDQALLYSEDNFIEAY